MSIGIIAEHESWGAARYDLTHARHDNATCLVPGLFRALKRGERKRMKLDLTYKYSEKESVRFIGFEPLGADDMRLLQLLTAAAGPRGLLLEPEPASEHGRELRTLLETKDKDDVRTQDALVVNESMYSILKEMNLTQGGENMKSLKASLVRMSNVTVIASKNSRQASYHLLSYTFDESTGDLSVALNPRIASAVLGGRHTRIDLNEVRALESDAARLMHQRLCGWINENATRKVDLDTLCLYIWPDTVDSAAMRKRRQRAREALREFEKIGWSVREYARNSYSIKRAKVEH